MNNNPAIFRALIIYAVCVPLAIMMGYLLTNPLDYPTLAVYGTVALAFAFPLLMRWHYALLIFSWSAALTIPFLKGAPLWAMMVMVSLGISIIECILMPNRRFISVPQITKPLVCLVAVICLTAKMTGGFGLQFFGSEVYGGRKYIYLLVGILSYFAITAKAIPPARAKWFVALFFLGETTKVVGDFYSVCPSFLHPIYLVFPPGGTDDPNGGGFQIGVSRLGGVGQAGVAICLWLLARHGVRGVFLGGKLWRSFLWLVAFGMVFLGGYRSALIGVLVVFSLMFFLEGLHRTRFVLVLAFLGMLAATAIIPLASRLPFSVQRTLAFLPLDINPEARGSADSSTEFRRKMRESVLRQVPKYLLVGKGYGISMEDFQNMGTDKAFKIIDASQQGLALSGDYHNGFLSVIIPFGLWGFLAYAWYMAACMWVLYNNWKHGNPALQGVSMVLLGLGVLEIVSFASFIGGIGLSSGVAYWAGWAGLSIALNNGVCRKKSPVAAEHPVFKPARTLTRLRPGLQP